MSLKYLLSAAIVAAGLAAPGAQAALYTVSVDTNVSYNQIGRQCRSAGCSITVESAAPGSIDVTPGGAPVTFDFLKFSGTGPGFLTYTITAMLHIGGETVTGVGSGFARFNGAGRINVGALDWSSIDSTSDKIAAAFQDGVTFLRGRSVTTSASVAIKDGGTPSVSAVPLPASAAALLLGLVGFGGYRRMQKRKAA